MLVSSTLVRRLARRVSPPLLGGLVAAAALLGAAPARAATLLVTDTSDVATDAGSLRHAVNAALPGDTITFAPSVTGVITLSPANGSLTLNPPAGGTAITISGPGANALAVDGGAASTVFAVSGGAVAISGLTLQNGMSPYYALGGGAVDVEGGGALTLTACTLSGNTAPSNASGGGLYVDYGCSATLKACAIVGNTASDGGGVYVNGTVSLLNCTVAGNAASTAGGGVYVDFNAGGCAIASSTLSGNTSAGTGGGLEVSYGAAASLVGSLIAGNTAGNNGGAVTPGPDITVDSVSPTFHGVVTSGGGNLIGIDDGGTNGDAAYAGNDSVGTAAHPINPRLDPEGLKMNGGPTPTVALLPGSPALDLVPAKAAPVTDQRGALRNVSGDGKSDCGAFEAQANDSITDLTVNANPALQGQNVTFTARVYTFTGTPTGSVKFATGGQTATAPVSASGTAALTTNALSLGYHAVTAAYSGDTRFRASQSAPLTEHILYASKTLKVTDKSDNPSDPGSIRSIVNNAQPGTSVTFPNLSGTITLTNGPLVGGDLSLLGPGAGSLTLDGNRNGSVLVITGGTVSISGLTFQNGLTTGVGGGIDQEAGTLTLTDCTLIGNTANYGGGLFAGGTATLSGCSITGNTGKGGTSIDGSSTSGGGGGVYAANPITLTGCTVAGNTTSADTGSYGGGIEGADAVTLNACAVTKNTASGIGGGVYAAGTLAVNACSVQGNTSSVDGGGLYGFGAVTLAYSLVQGNTAARDAGGLYANGALTAPYSALLGNTSSSVGGGVYTGDAATLTGCIVSGNTSLFSGGGLFGAGASSGGFFGAPPVAGPLVSLTGCTVSGNTSTASYGGGLYLSGPLTLTGSTLSGNTAGEGGGGLYCSDQTLVADCTLANNAAQGDSGGGLYDDGFLTLTACTLTGNSDPKFSGGGLYVDYQPYQQVTATLQADLIARNTAGTDPDVAVSTSFSSTDPDAPVVTSNGYNLIGVGGVTYAPAPNKNDQVGTASRPINPQLDPNGLQFNGGLTQTIALMAGSPALDKVPAKAAQAADQRGAPRPGNNDGKADIGAYEAQLKNSGKGH